MISMTGELSDGSADVPIVDDFWAGVRAEKAHQLRRWGTTKDRNKDASEWYWLVGYLAGKALFAAIGGDLDKAKHHTISTAAALSCWHDSLSEPHDASRPSDLEVAVGREFIVSVAPWEPPFSAHSVEDLECPACEVGDVRVREKETYSNGKTVDAYCEECHALLDVTVSMEPMFGDVRHPGEPGFGT